MMISFYFLSIHFVHMHKQVFSVSSLVANNYEAFVSAISKHCVFVSLCIKRNVLLNYKQLSVTMESRMVEIVERKESKQQKFNATKIQIKFRIKEKHNLETREDIYKWFNKCFDEVLQPVAEEFSSKDQVGLKIGIHGKMQSNPIGIGFRDISSLSGEIITDLLTMVQQSNDCFNSSDDLDIELTVIKVPGAVEISASYSDALTPII